MRAIERLNTMSDAEVTEHLTRKAGHHIRIGASSKGGIYRIWHDVGCRRRFVTGSRWSEVWMKAWQEWPDVFAHLHEPYKTYRIKASCLSVAEDTHAEPFERETYEQLLSREKESVKGENDLTPENRRAFTDLMTSYAQRLGNCHAE